MSKIGKNIQKIRKVKKMSQTAFSELFGLSRTSVGAYEEGRAEPKTDTIIQIAKYFGLSIDSLLTKTIAVNDLYKISKYDKFLTSQNPLSDSKTYVVLNEALAHYTSHIGEQEFLDGLPVFSMSFLQLENERIFQIDDQYLICVPYISQIDDAYLLVTQSGLSQVVDLPKKNKDILEIWVIRAKISIPDFDADVQLDRVSKLELEVEEIKKLLKLT